MKKIIISSLILMASLFSGCTSTTNTLDKETYEQFVNYHETIGKKCIEYINNDSTISGRTKNTLLKKYEIMDETLKTIKVQE